MIHLSVHGASGVGKTAVGRWLHENAGVLWLEIDQSPRDGMEILELRHEWDEFRSGGAGTGFFTELDRRAQAKRRRHCVLTFPSTCFLGEDELARAAGRLVAVELRDAPGRCLDRFLGRVPEMERAAAIRHWAEHNAEACARTGGRTVAVARNGGLRELAEIAAELEVIRVG